MHISHRQKQLLPLLPGLHGIINIQNGIPREHLDIPGEAIWIEISKLSIGNKSGRAFRTHKLTRSID